MSHNCFISFKKEDEYYCKKIAELLKIESMSGKYLDEWIDSEDLDYVMQRIRKEYMKGSSVTLYLIGKHSSENEGLDEFGRSKQSFMIRELQATLFDRKGNSLSGLIGIVLPEMESEIFGDSYRCETCGKEISIVRINDETVLREFSQNYLLEKGDCDHYPEDGRFCVLVKYSDFIYNPQKYIDQAFDKTKSKIAEKVHYRDISHKGLKSYK